jgi:hypothetical protein
VYSTGFQPCQRHTCTLQRRLNLLQLLVRQNNVSPYSLPVGADVNSLKVTFFHHLTILPIPSAAGPADGCSLIDSMSAWQMVAVQQGFSPFSTAN